MSFGQLGHKMPFRPCCRRALRFQRVLRRRRRRLGCRELVGGDGGVEIRAD
jgi:hypothetical protein